MFCPVCQHKDTRVVDSRVLSSGLSVRRRRECSKCAFRYSTLEQIEILDLSVVKRDGKREPYNKEKLISGLKRSLEKRSYTQDSFNQLVGLIEQDIQKLKKQEITTEQLGEIVMKQLKRFDKVGYIRFASVYRAFEDVETFQEEVKSLTKKNKRRKK